MFEYVILQVKFYKIIKIKYYKCKIYCHIYFNKKNLILINLEMVYY